MSEPVPQAVHFDATLLPHRSLPREGFHALIAALIAANLILGVPMFLFGAWPVIGFMGLDIALVVFLFRLNYKSGPLAETLRLTDTDLVVTRIHPGGVSGEPGFGAPGLRVERDTPPQHESRLVLVSRGNRLVVGRFLTPEERLEVANNLRAALARMKARRFDHDWA